MGSIDDFLDSRKALLLALVVKLSKRCRRSRKPIQSQAGPRHSLETQSSRHVLRSFGVPLYRAAALRAGIVPGIPCLTGEPTILVY